MSKKQTTKPVETKPVAETPTADARPIAPVLTQ